MAVKKKTIVKDSLQEELGNELLLEDNIETNDADGANESMDVDTIVDAEELSAQAEQLDEVEETEFTDLRSHAGSYVAANKRNREALVSVCWAKTGKRVLLSERQLKQLIDYSKGDWLDIKYSDSTNTILIGKSLEEQGVFPIFDGKKFIIYDTLTVKDFKDTLYLDFDGCSSRSAYTCKMVRLNSSPYIALTHEDFQ